MLRVHEAFTALLTASGCELCQIFRGVFATSLPLNDVNKHDVTLYVFSDLVLVDLLLQDLISVRVHLHLFLFFQFPPQPGQVLLEGIRRAVV